MRLLGGSRHPIPTLFIVCRPPMPSEPGRRPPLTCGRPLHSPPLPHRPRPTNAQLSEIRQSAESLLHQGTRGPEPIEVPMQSPPKVVSKHTQPAAAGLGLNNAGAKATRARFITKAKPRQRPAFARTKQATSRTARTGYLLEPAWPVALLPPLRYCRKSACSWAICSRTCIIACASVISPFM